MECNREEASRAKEISEKKFLEKDINGAKKFALKAQCLNPALEGIHQLLATLDVYINAEKKINGVVDWYHVLDVNPQADGETIRKSFIKLALTLHPDKNKSVGADGAFNLISEAWNLLSDKAKRMVYDHMRNGSLPKNIPISTKSSATPGCNGFSSSTKPNTKNPKNTHRNVQKHAPDPSHVSKPNTFWTVCHRCKMQYEYLRVYLNRNLLCPNCRQAFMATETYHPSTRVGSKLPTSKEFPHQHKHSDHQAETLNRNPPKPENGSRHDHGHANSNHFSSLKPTPPPKPEQAASVAQRASDKTREREEVKMEEPQGASSFSKRAGGTFESGETNNLKRKKVVQGVSARNQAGSFLGGPATNAHGSTLANAEVGKANGCPNPSKPGSFHDISRRSDIQTLLIEKARKEICKKLAEWKSVPSRNSAINGGTKSISRRDRPGRSAALADNDECGPSREPHGIVNSVNREMSVPDPDFHDFDKDRAMNCFGENQVWSLYDDNDGMPRYYALIHNVISWNPLKMRISWLNSKTSSEFGQINWVGSGFIKTCGDFRVGKYKISSSINSFSQKVKWVKGARGVIGIYPRKGDVWALYRNWSPGWNELTAVEVIHKYDMVEVLEDYGKERGTCVAPLVKVAGFKTVFHRHLNPSEIRRIPREEMFRFSHQVPSYLLTGHEAANAPKGCRELDPAATPADLLQVVIDTAEEGISESEK